MNIVYEDEEIIVVEKPPGIPTQEDKTYDKDMLTLVKEYLGSNYNVNLLHRLDRPVGGIMLFPKTERACKDFNKDMQLKKIIKTYLAVVCGDAQPTAELKDYLLKNGRLNKSRVVQKGVSNSKEAILKYELLSTVQTKKFGKLSLLKINLITGRHHQIRVQLSSRGLPLWGDTKYNKYIKYEPGFINIALWSHKLEFYHPKTKCKMALKLAPKDVFPFNIEEFRLYYL